MNIGKFSISNTSQEDGFNKYLRTIKDIPRLSHVQQRQLAITYKDPLSTEEQKQSAFNTLVECNLQLVIKISNKIFKSNNFNIDIMDLIDAGNMGLMRAVKQYNPYNKSNSNFCTFAYILIQSNIVRELRRHNMISIPTNHYAARNQIKNHARITDELLKRVNQSFSINNSLIHIDAIESENAVDNLFKYDSSNTLSDELGKQDLFAILRNKVDHLPESQKQVLLDLYFNDKEWTIVDLAKKYGKSKQYISQSAIRGINTLKTRLSPELQEQFMELLN